MSDRDLEQAEECMLRSNFLVDKGAGSPPQSNQPDGLTEPSSPVGGSGDTETRLQQLRELVDEIATYILYFDVLRRFFHEDLKKEDMIA
jgi:hypothetical protein